MPIPEAPPAAVLFTPHNAWLLLAAVSLGGLVGLVRQWNERENNAAGARTFALWSCFGYLCAKLQALDMQPGVLTGLIVVTVLMCVFSLRTDVRGGLGLTTMTAGILTFVAGSLLGAGHTRYAVILCILVSALISIRRLTTSWSAKLTETDMRAALQFAFLSGVILPLVPNEKLGGVFNPYDTWRMVMLVSGVNLAGYAAMRFLGGGSGAALTGLVGGFASSTAVTLSFSKKSREFPETSSAHAQGVLLACATMLPRVLMVLFALNPDLARELLFPVLTILAVTLITPLWLRLRGGDEAEGDSPTVRNPLRLRQAVKFAALYSVIVMLLEVTREHADAAGFYAISFVSGLSDMDAITLSLSQRTLEETLPVTVAGSAILLAMTANTVVKLALATTLGSPRFRRYLAIGLGLPLVTLIGLVATRFAF